MRRFVFILGLVVLATEAPAADYEVPILRGSTVDIPSPYVPAPPVYTGWEGFYAGGQIGLSRAGVDFTTTVGPLISEILRDSTIQAQVLGFNVLQSRDDTSSYNAGVFAGFNTQWDDVVVGFEASYGHTNLNKTASDSENRIFINNGQAPPGHTFQYNVTVTAAASVQITDLWTGRLRAGWVLGDFLPYGFVGPAVARANVLRSASVSGTLTDTFTQSGVEVSNTTALVLPGPLTEGQGGLFTWGFTAGLGADYKLTQTVFARGEWELVELQDVKGAKVNINTIRTGIGVRF